MPQLDRMVPKIIASTVLMSILFTEFDFLVLGLRRPMVACSLLGAKQGNLEIRRMDDFLQNGTGTVDDLGDNTGKL